MVNEARRWAWADQEDDEEEDGCGMEVTEEQQQEEAGVDQEAQEKEEKVEQIRRRLQAMEDDNYPKDIVELTRRHLKEEEAKLRIGPIKAKAQLNQCRVEREKKHAARQSAREKKLDELLHKISDRRPMEGELGLGKGKAPADARTDKRPIPG